MLGFILLIALGVSLYCVLIYPFAVKLEQRQRRGRGDRWRRWMGREDEVEDIPWGGPELRKSKPLPPPLDPNIDAHNDESCPVIPVTSDRPYKPPMRG